MHKTLLVLGCFTIPAAISQLNAGQLTELHQTLVTDAPTVEAAQYISKAAEQQVVTEKRNYLPKLSVDAKELQVHQRVSRDDTGIFTEGSDTYENTRAKIELDQPLIDLSLKPKVESARALQAHQEDMLALAKERQTRRVLEHYIDASRYFALQASYTRVVDRLEAELTKVSKSFDAKLATVSDVEHVKLALSAMQHEQRVNREQLEFKLLDLNLNADALDNGWVQLAEDAQLDDFTEGRTPRENSLEVSALQAETQAFGQRIKSTKREDLPRLSLYGLYQYDNSDGSVFGGGRTFSGYEVGLSLTWDLFDRGINRSEARRLGYLKRAKEAEMRAIQGRTNRDRQIAEHSLMLAQKNVSNIGQLVEHHNAIRKAAEKSHEVGGTESYLNMINSFLLYESQIRQYESARFDYLNKQIQFYGQSFGWNAALVAAVDNQFIPTK